MLYLPNPKWRINETFIYFKIGSVLKNIIETEAAFTKPERINEWDVNFLQNCSIDI